MVLVLLLLLLLLMLLGIAVIVLVVDCFIFGDVLGICTVPVEGSVFLLLLLLLKNVNFDLLSL